MTPVYLPSGTLLRAITSTQPFHFNRADHLANASTISTAISGQTTFASGVLHGDSPFAVEHVSSADFAALTVDMTWTCGAPTTDETLAQGYVFRASDLGCPGIQKFVIRYLTNPNRVTLEQYGNRALYLVEPTTTTTLGQAFTFERGSLSLDATVRSHTANAMVLQVDSMQYNGANACTAGTYTVAHE